MNDINFSFNTTSNQNAQKNKREERAIKIGKDTRASLLMKRRENFIQACSSPFLIFTVNRVRTAPLLLSCLLFPLPAQLWYRFFIKLSDSFSSKITLIRWWMEMTKKSSRLPRCSDDSCPRVCRSSVWTMSRCQSSKYLCHCHWCSLLLCRILKERQQHASAVRSRLGFVQYCFWLIWWYIFFFPLFFSLFPSFVHTYAVVQAGAIDEFIRLLNSPTVKIQEQAIWGLANIAGDTRDYSYRDYILSRGVMDQLLLILNDVCSSIPPDSFRFKASPHLSPPPPGVSPTFVAVVKTTDLVLRLFPSPSLLLLVSSTALRRMLWLMLAGPSPSLLMEPLNILMYFFSSSL